MSAAFVKTLGADFLASMHSDSRSLIVSEMFASTVGEVKRDWNVEMTHRVVKDGRGRPIDSVAVELNPDSKVKMLWIDWCDLCANSVDELDIEMLNEECLVTNAAVYVPVSKGPSVRKLLNPDLVTVIDATVFRDGVLRLKLV
jgi:hypothetical protein